MLLVIGLVIYPVGEVVRLSFTNTSLLVGRSDFVGLQSYQRIVADPLFDTVVRNTAQWVLLGTALTMLLGLSVGYFLSFNYRINRLLRASILIPWLLPAVVSVAAWRWMYSAEEGVINDVLKRTGLIERGIPWLGDPSLVIYALIVVAVWRLLPFGALVISAAVQGIPNSYLEAATIDGANGWQKFRYIVLPRADVPVDRHRHPGVDLEHERSDHRVGLDTGRPGRRQPDPVDVDLLGRLQLVPLRIVVGVVGDQLLAAPAGQHRLPAGAAPHVGSEGAMTQVTLAAPRPRVARRSEASHRRCASSCAASIPTAIGLVIFVVLAFPIVWLVDTSFKDAYAARAIPPQYIPLQPDARRVQGILRGRGGRGHDARIAVLVRDGRQQPVRGGAAGDPGHAHRHASPVTASRASRSPAGCCC